ncbi:ABC transporter periplasmic oligopeptide-binding protein [Pseudomonas syringae pv. philadelphi]|uniref:ABC transporter periplasmic oligopeptide-binding protein n=1 Tax=Pseudomonas syringae pv. philadelphi TaxID=251706 RepID=A0A3M3YRV7_9PSED|nr:ABC transporter substrate-binding protein [Pseudomonas syringae group genomosp. 3]RMO84484.1 ABC transporter periplasmic oligopeptide-binding protein [Pseudomonas syringae pv. philadelphi]
MRRLTALAMAITLSGSAWAATPPDTLVVARSIDDIASLDPAESFEITATNTLANIYQRLLEPDRQNPSVLVPALASSWKAGDDDKSLIFELRNGARFASGNGVRPDDVIYSLSRVVKLNKSPAFILGELGWTAENVDSFLTRVDDTHVKTSWPAAVGSSFALSILSATPVGFVVDGVEVGKHAQGGDLGNSWLKNHSAGTGSYALRSYVPHEALVLQANPHAAKAPKLKTVILKNVTDPATRRLLVVQGDADLAFDLGADQFSALEKQKGVSVQRFPSSMIYYLAINSGNTQVPALKNPAFWEAARWLVDYQSISKDLLKNQYSVHQAFLPAGVSGSLSDKPFKLDVDKAKAALKAGGIAEGTKIELNVFNQPPYTDIAQALQASFAKASIEISVRPLVESEVLAKMRARDFQLIFTYWGMDYLDPHSNASAFTYNVANGPKTIAWRTQWDIPQLSQETRAAAAERDPQKRIALYTHLQKTVQESSPFVVALQGQNQVAVHDGVEGVLQNITVSLPYFDQVSKSK